MAKTLAYLVDQAENAVDGPLDARTDVTDLVNDAGQHMVSMHDWSWLVRPPGMVNFTANQEFVELPEEAQEVLKVENTSNVNSSVQPTTPEDLLHVRGSIFTSQHAFWYAVVFPGQNDFRENAPQPRLEIYPTPTTDSSKAFRVLYRAGWTTLSNMNSVANVPRDMEALLTELVRGFARAAQGARLTQELDLIDASALLNRLKTRYGSIQRDLGMAAGGAVESLVSEVYRPFTSITKS